MIDVQGADIGAVDIGFMGLDGQLPVLDVVQLAAHYARSLAGLHAVAEVGTLKVVVVG